MRLQKAIAESGYCSRRRAEELIREGIVTVNGEVASIGLSVTDEDEILIDGKPLKNQVSKKYIVLNKPPGYTCTNRRFKGEKNIFDLVDVDDRLFVVGRLDKNSRGLVVLTNDGDFAQKMSHPRYHHEKVYEITITNKKDLDPKDIISCLKKGITSDGEFLIAKKASYLGNNIFKVTLTEGKKRQLRRMFGSLNLPVTDLLRTQIGNIKLSELKEKEWKEIKKPS